MNYNFVELDAEIKKVVKPSRYAHSKGVEYTSAALAMRYGKADKEILVKARVAGILHDNAKCMSDEELLEFCDKNDISVNEFEKNSPFLLHGKVGSFLAKTKLGIEDEDILNAITYHTTGRPAMSLLEKIVFVADYIEPDRYVQKDLEEIRFLAFTDIDKCVYKISEDTLNYLKSNNMTIDEMTVKTRDFYKGI